MTTRFCAVCGASFGAKSVNHVTCSKACARKRFVAQRRERLVREAATRPRTSGSWGLDCDPYATGALCADAMHCPVM